MKIQYCSDLHLEFPENNDFLRHHPLEVASDILILAGDILPFALLRQAYHFLDWASANYKAVY